MERKYVYSLIAIGLGITWLFMTWNKWGYEIDLLGLKLNVVVASIIFAVITTGIAIAILAWTHYSDEMPGLVYGILIVGFLLCGFVGQAITRPAEVQAESGTSQTGGNNSYYFFGGSSDSSDSDSDSDSSSSSDSDSDMPGEILIALCVLAYVVMLLIGSFLITNFWIVSTASIVMLGILFAAREFTIDGRY